MAADLKVEVLRRPSRRDPREAQDSYLEVGAGGSVERIRWLIYRNRIRGVWREGEQARDREVLHPQMDVL